MKYGIYVLKEPLGRAFPIKDHGPGTYIVNTAMVTLTMDNSLPVSAPALIDYTLVRSFPANHSC